MPIPGMPIVSAPLLSLPTLQFIGEHQANATSSISYADITEGIQSGDLGMICHRVHNNGGNTIGGVTPSGHTNVFERNDSSGNSRIRSAISFKVLSGTETTVSILAGGGTISVFRPVGFSIDTFTGNSAIAAGSNGSPADDILASAETDLPILNCFIYTGRGATGLPGTMTFTPADAMTVNADPAGATWLCGYNVVGEGETPIDINVTSDDTFDRATLVGGYLDFTRL